MSADAVDLTKNDALGRHRPVLTVTDLHIALSDGTELVRGVDFVLNRGGALGIVGESGSGKSLTCRAILGILPDGVSTTEGSIDFDGLELTELSAKQWRPLRGTRISAVFQDPAAYLNPSIRVGVQLAEALRSTAGLSRSAAKQRAVELFDRMGLRNPAAVYRQYPYELSGGMLQRVLIAIAVCAEPELLIADEATTALDVTVQAAVLDLIDDLRVELGLALVLVSHDLAVVGQVCDDVIVMRHGVVVEAGPSRQLLDSPRHDYTAQLVDNHRDYGLEAVLEKESAGAR
ncbi:ABC transporter ATP-binding protein [Rhodococcus sp. 06-156-3C]|uniref:ABC transporter ATP-binding protein n=1 Tax=Nocardiaceae TaxID=85025 RepID=UPI0005230C69|nr:MULTISPECIES: ABC transporter ATP-binding protein [Rhodococcus]OZD11076.1 ABC transporter ATP-binding protein [Rhodococcus sp. 06-156-4C]OZD14492.1 ABC transporter ATP-binding protein [Rhodococcus sp. 06-156-4a]OZD24826.1 ABC transporter ATP-binding protein [Rhodococcus sp. 06-156-3C]OZD27800.1 ABC transporter ATP-binding protein [Rhodococcus sp. 06-156-3b]OZD39781.1 ABC transporter ATP-binding protein [Rhodococcus sp. 06-156-3]